MSLRTHPTTSQDEVFAFGRIPGPAGRTGRWRFYRDRGALSLRFLTTFGGNTTPILLDEISSETNAVVFKARDPSYLTVRVEPGERRTWIRVFLRGERHVVIRLDRRE